MPKIIAADDKILFLNQSGSDTFQGAIDQALASQKMLFVGLGVYQISNIWIRVSIEI